MKWWININTGRNLGFNLLFHTNIFFVKFNGWSPALTSFFNQQTPLGNLYCFLGLAKKSYGSFHVPFVTEPEYYRAEQKLTYSARAPPSGHLPRPDSSSLVLCIWAGPFTRSKYRSRLRSMPPARSQLPKQGTALLSFSPAWICCSHGQP